MYWFYCIRYIGSKKQIGSQNILLVGYPILSRLFYRSYHSSQVASACLISDYFVPVGGSVAVGGTGRR